MSSGAVIVLALVPIELLVATAVFYGLIRSSWGDLADRFPAKEVGAAAVRRDFQSIRIGLSNFGGCVHIAVDDECLHMLPAAFLRWFGARAMSVPWAKVEVTKPGTRLSTVKIEGVEVGLPPWCAELAGDE